jgi:hypothetical protein
MHARLEVTGVLPVQPDTQQQRFSLQSRPRVIDERHQGNLARLVREDLRVRCNVLAQNRQIVIVAEIIRQAMQFPGESAQALWRERFQQLQLVREILGPFPPRVQARHRRLGADLLQTLMPLPIETQECPAQPRPPVMAHRQPRGMCLSPMQQPTRLPNSGCRSRGMAMCFIPVVHEPVPQASRTCDPPGTRMIHQQPV